jgi:hypothetical protein
MIRWSVCIAVILLVLWGCDKEAARPAEPVRPVEPAPVESEPVSEPAIEDVSDAVTEVDTLDQELDDSELDDIDQQLADIDW